MTETTIQTETKRRPPSDFFDLTPEEQDEFTRRFNAERKAKQAAKFQKLLSKYGYDLERCEFKPE